MKYFVLVRFLDILTTLYGLRAGQYEFNPYNDWLLRRGILIFLIFHLSIIWLIGKLYRHRLVKTAVNIFTVINFLVVALNVLLILLVVLGE